MLAADVETSWRFIEVHAERASGVCSRTMRYRFGPYELDTSQVELRADGARRPVEPQVFALLALLVENRERLVSRDELIEKVWDGRVVSDAALASRVKSARRALGDDGTAQRYIRTIHGQGYRFVAEVRASHDVQATAIPDERPGAGDGSRPSLAVLPFRLVGEAGPHAAIAEALPHELIAELARLRWLFVTARGSSFRLREPAVEMSDVGRLLGVRYCLAGSVEVTGTRLVVTIRLVDTRDSGVVWAERYAVPIDDVHALRADICSKVLIALELRIPLHEAGIARLSVSERLDAWSAYHLGLQHMYRFNRRDNEIALGLFEQAVARDPAFARAHAGLSFVHFQTAFLQYSADRASEVALARRCAERGVELDPLDPFVNTTMGRSHWLVGDLEGATPWLHRAIDVNPNYAQGFYTLAVMESMGQRGSDSHAHVNLAMQLSPLDPLYYAMAGTRAFALWDLGRDTEAAVWAERAARSPGAHVLIAMIAAAAHALDGDAVRAAAWAANARARNPALTRTEFFRAFPMRSATMKERVSAALAGLGL